MKIAVEGCCHGELDKIYETIAHLEERDNIKVDLLICCGDFQAIRNPSDLNCMAVPQKYRKMNTFYKYYSGEAVAPVLTLFIGGNHEASNYMQELPYGGWVAPKIYYMGYANVLNFGGVRIGGLSGIYKSNHFLRGHYEKLPYDNDSTRSAYHIRNLEIFRLKQIAKPIDMFLSHDWPEGIYRYGNVEQLLKRKPFFREDIEKGELGSPPAMEVLMKLKPSYWFSAHLHNKFAAIVDHGDDMMTRFLSLDKCLPKRQFLQIVDMPHESSKPLQLELDPEWLAILKTTNHLMSLSRNNVYMPGPSSSNTESCDFTVTTDLFNRLDEDFGGIYTVPDNFEITAPTWSGEKIPKHFPQPDTHVNPQTTLLCEMLGLINPNAVFTGTDSMIDISSGNQSHGNQSLGNRSLGNPDEIGIDGDLSDDDAPDTSCEVSYNSTPGSLTPNYPTPTLTPGGRRRLLMPSPGAGSPSSISGLSPGRLYMPPPGATSSPVHSSPVRKLPLSLLDSSPTCKFAAHASLSYSDASLADARPPPVSMLDLSDESLVTGHSPAPSISPATRKTSDDLQDLSLASPANDHSLDSSNAFINASSTQSDLDISSSDIDKDPNPKPKKFIRRNISLYSSNAEDS